LRRRHTAGRNPCLACPGKGQRIATATFFTTQTDFTYAGDLKVFVDEAQIASIETAMKKNGYLDGSKMATAFNMLRASDLIWPYVVNNYLKGKDPMPFDLLYWNSDATRMPAANHSYYLRNCYLENNLSQGKMELAGKTLKLGDIKIPIYNLAAKEDHIAPARSAYIGGKLFGGDVTYVMAGSGHIAGVVNPPEAGKYQFWSDGPQNARVRRLGSRRPGNARLLVAALAQWIREGSDEEVPARKPGGKKLKPLEDAPGSYVRVRV
jgi:polyhydroxyalkanoate synthase